MLVFPRLPNLSRIENLKKKLPPSGYPHTQREQQLAHVMSHIGHTPARPDSIQEDNNGGWLLPLKLITSKKKDKYKIIYTYTWNPKEVERPRFGGLKPQNGGQTGSR